VGSSTSSRTRTGTIGQKNSFGNDPRQSRG
jgi:hypothetical protein